MLAPEFLPVWGGVGTYIVELVRHLPSSLEIHVVTPMRYCLGKDKVSTSDFLLSKYFGDNVKIHYVSTARDTFFYNAAFQYACLKYVPKLIEKEHITLVHSHTAHMPDLLLQFTKLECPVVTTIHTTIQGQREGTKNSRMHFSGLESSEKITYLAYPVLRLAEIVYFSKRRSYITVSNWMRQQMVKQYPKIACSSFSVIHNAVDTARFSPGIPNSSERNIVLFTGRLIAAKGINYLVEAMPLILREYPETLFIFIGSGNSEPYEERLTEMGVSERNFAFIGYIKEEDTLVKYYQASSVYVAPTLYENLPIRILEAMACGIPVVASNICAIPEVIDSYVNGILIAPGSIEELAGAVNCLLGNSKLRKLLGERARKTVLNKFNYSISTFKTLRLYRQIVEGCHTI